MLHSMQASNERTLASMQASIIESKASMKASMQASTDEIMASNERTQASNEKHIDELRSNIEDVKINVEARITQVERSHEASIESQNKRINEELGSYQTKDEAGAQRKSLKGSLDVAKKRIDALESDNAKYKELEKDFKTVKGSLSALEKHPSLLGDAASSPAKSGNKATASREADAAKNFGDKIEKDLGNIKDFEDTVKIERAQEKREVQADDVLRGSLPKDPDILCKVLRGKTRSSLNGRVCTQKWRSSGSQSSHKNGRTSISRMSLDQRPQKGRQRRVHATTDGQVSKSALMLEYRFVDKPP
jgi:hypothetical protein